MQLHPKKKIEIVVESACAKRLIEMIEKDIKITQVVPEIVDMPLARIIKLPLRAPLPAPVESLDRPAEIAPVGDRFQIFLEEVGAPRLEQDAARATIAAAEAAQIPSCRGLPVINHEPVGPPAPIEETDVHAPWLLFGKWCRLVSLSCRGP